MIKKEDRAFLDESLRGHIAKAKEAYAAAVEGVCLRGEPEDLEEMDRWSRRYLLLLKAQTLLTDASA